MLGNTGWPCRQSPESEVRFDERDEIGRGAMHAALELLACQLGKPALYLIDPGSRYRREMNMPMKPTGQPGLRHRGFVRGGVVHHEMDVQAVSDPGVDTLQ
ncbi:hypothetical protein GCM10023158_17790 [Gluconacetobacter tumulicola]